MAIRNINNIQKEIALPSKYSDLDKQAIGEAIVQRIVNRTRSGLDVNGNPFKYAPDSEHKGNNLSDTGDMLTELDVVEVTTTGVVVGYSEPQSLEANQAEGHQINIQSKGKYKKPFIGISQDELDIILANYDQNTQNTDQTINSFIDNLFKSQGLE